MSLTVGLVACSKSKANQPMTAAALYTSPLFRKGADYCRRHYDHWFILSALHGLVAPKTVLTPYDVTLNRQNLDLRRAWTNKVIAALRRRRLLHAKFFLHAGRSYVDMLLDRLDCECPLRGLGISAQLAWYKERQ
jgi:hypothetical protein